MFQKIKIRIEQELKSYIRGLEKNYHLKSLSPLILRSIKEFILRKGKRIRPILFCIGYLGFAEKVAPGLFRSAVSLELLHDFMLIHDDIIDKSDIRRGKPSMHLMLQRQLPHKKLKFNGQDLAIVIGDVIYALALDVFLEVKGDPKLKEQSLKQLISAVLYTGSGEFIELLLGARDLKKVTKKDIYKIYQYKTSNYTFASPLVMGAILAGADKKQIKTIFEYGIKLGIAFQIKDDIIGLFGKSSDTGKPNLTDIQEAKKTLLLWHAYHNSTSKDRKIIEKIFSAKNVEEKNLCQIQKIILNSKSIDFAKKEIDKLRKESESLLQDTGMKPKYQILLKEFSEKILTIEPYLFHSIDTIGKIMPR